MVPVQDLILLGLLMQRELHGYEIKQIVAEQMSQIARIPPGTIYYTLKKLERRGLVTARMQRQGRRPERRVYGISAAGRAVFRDLLRQAMFVDERPYQLFDAVLYFYLHASKRDLLAAVEHKLEAVGRFNQELAGLQAKYPGRWPFPLEALKRKGEMYSQGLEGWYRFLKRGLRARLGRAAANDSQARAR